MLSVANSCHYDENSKNGKNRLQTNARPSEATPTTPTPEQKLGCKSPRVGANFGANPRGCAGGCLWMKLISALRLTRGESNQKKITRRVNVRLRLYL